MGAYLNLFLLTIFAVLFSGAFLLFSRIFGPQKPNPIKGANFECGLPVEGRPIGKFPVKFYLVVILFLLFDLEVVFFYPWAIQASTGVNITFWLIEGLVFAGILLVGWWYVVKQGVLEWGQKIESQGIERRESVSEKTHSAR
jgi:NADH-quinone oxidoreductase subunit A